MSNRFRRRLRREQMKKSDGPCPKCGGNWIVVKKSPTTGRLLYLCENLHQRAKSIEVAT